MNIDELNILIRTNLAASDDLLKRLIAGAHRLTENVDTHMRKDSDGDIVGESSYVRCIQYSENRNIEKITFGQGSFTHAGEMLFTLVFDVSKALPNLKVFVDVAARGRGPRVQFSLWNAPNNPPRAVNFVDEGDAFIDTIVEELKRHFEHDVALGELTDTSVSDG